nr:MAG TPA: hypothetical protein [Caudoviricetes sp.]
MIAVKKRKWKKERILRQTATNGDKWAIARN